MMLGFFFTRFEFIISFFFFCFAVQQIPGAGGHGFMFKQAKVPIYSKQKEGILERGCPHLIAVVYITLTFGTNHAHTS